MQNSITIPIKNIYYMLCYAWDKVDYLNRSHVGQLEEQDLGNLFAKVLTNELVGIVKKGLHKEYISYQDEMSIIRGKINFKENSMSIEKKRGQVVCEIDELHWNILLNQIIKTTIMRFLRVSTLSIENHNILKKQLQYFKDIDAIALNSRIFTSIQFNKSNHRYKFIINVCKLIHDNLLLAEDGIGAMFYDFRNDEIKMARLFEEFVRNFYRYHLKEARVYRENIRWNMTGNKLDYLPIMQTDISIEWKDKKTIIDTKYYKEALKANRGSEKVSAGNLYQIYSYLKNNENKSMKDKCAEGMLLYPKVGQELRLNYMIDEHKLSIYTVNLDARWQDIHRQLLEIV